MTSMNIEGKKEHSARHLNASFIHVFAIKSHIHFQTKYLQNEYYQIVQYIN